METVGLVVLNVVFATILNPLSYVLKLGCNNKFVNFLCILRKKFECFIINVYP